MALLINAQVVFTFVKLVWVLVKAATWPLRLSVKEKVSALVAKRLEK